MTVRLNGHLRISFTVPPFWSFEQLKHLNRIGGAGKTQHIVFSGKFLLGLFFLEYNHPQATYVQEVCLHIDIAPSRAVNYPIC